MNVRTRTHTTPDKPRSDDAELATVHVATPISVIVPTYREVENIPLMIERLDSLRQSHRLDLELLFMDDDSNDGSVDAVAAAGHEWCHIIVRKADHGLSNAVIDGFRRAKHPILVCMDGDLSHPPEVIPRMILALAAGAQFVFGSRYVPGGTTDDDWGMLRWLNSRIATVLARPLTNARDPMSGFFALRKADFDQADGLDPVGYKIALEIIVKCGFSNIAEVPIHFSDRIHGESKLTLRQQLLYIKHLRRLYLHRFANAMYMAQFAAVGASGVVVNLTVLTVLQFMGFRDALSLAGGIAVSVCTNFLLNRRFTFSYARDRSIWRQFLGFISVSAVGIAVNYGVALFAAARLPDDMPLTLHLAALMGVACGMIFNYLGNRYVIFRKTRIRRRLGREEDHGRRDRGLETLRRPAADVHETDAADDDPRNVEPLGR
jgi:dolichol-phosphate mannosyltransferase